MCYVLLLLVKILFLLPLRAAGALWSLFHALQWRENRVPPHAPSCICSLFCVISRPFWGIMFIMYFWYFSLSSWRFHWFFSFSCISIRCALILRPMRMQKDKLFAMYFFSLPVYASRIIMQTSLWVCSLLWWHNPLGWIFVLFAWNSSCTPVNMYVEQIWFPSVLVILIRFFRTGSKFSSPTIL